MIIYTVGIAQNVIINKYLFTLRQGKNIICPIDRQAIDRRTVRLESIFLLLVQSESLPGGIS